MSFFAPQRNADYSSAARNRSAKAAKNLRSKNVSVAATSVTVRITFPTPEVDPDYAVFLEQSWLSNRAVSDKTPEGFTVTFEKPAPEKATVDWMLIR